MFEISLWFLFPLAIIISTISAMIGIGGAILFSPILIILLGLDPLQAFATGIFIEIFSFSSGLSGYLRRKVVPISKIKILLLYTIPGALLGVFIAQFIPSLVLKLLLFALLIYFGFTFVFEGRQCLYKHPHLTAYAIDKSELVIDSTMKVTSCFGGTLLGMLSAGLGEINEYNFLKRKHMNPSASAGSSIFLVSITAAVVVTIHILFLLFNQEFAVLIQIVSILMLCVPGVIIGAQIGVRMSRRFDNLEMELFAGCIFLSVATILILEIMKII